MRDRTSYFGIIFSSHNYLSLEYRKEQTAVSMVEKNNNVVSFS